MKKTMKCKVCGEEVARSAKNCPHCGAKLKMSGCLLSIIVIIMIIFIIIVTTTLNSSDSVNTTESNLITLEEFNNLQTGISYEEAVEIVGGEGTVLSTSEISSYKTTIYTWNGKGSLGANANATFQNGRLVSKAQFGLK